MIDLKIPESIEFQVFHKISLEYKKYLHSKKAPAKLEGEFKEALKNYRTYLNRLNVQLNPLWVYDEDDISTWQYIDFEVEKSGEKIKKWVKNPVFKYKHLIT